MKIFIEKYRTFDIHFDTDEESFFCMSERYDRQSEKQSFAAVKKDIDDFIKKSTDFKSFLIQKVEKWGSLSIENFTPIKVIGIRKDGRFVIEKNGKAEQLSDYDIKDYAIFNPKNDALIEELNQLKAQRQDLVNKEDALAKRFKAGRLLSEVKKEMIGNH